MGADRGAARAGRTGVRVAGRGSRVAGLVLATLALALLPGCGGSEREAPTPTVAVTLAPSPSPEAVAPAGDPGVTVEHVILACREKNGDLLRTFLADPVPDEEIEALFARGTDVLLTGRTPAVVQDGRATVEVRLEVRRGGEVEMVERRWRLERSADGVWRFTRLPDCF